MGSTKSRIFALGIFRHERWVTVGLSGCSVLARQVYQKYETTSMTIFTFEILELVLQNSQPSLAIWRKFLKSVTAISWGKFCSAHRTALELTAAGYFLWSGVTCPNCRVLITCGCFRHTILLALQLCRRSISHKFVFLTSVNFP